MAVAEVINSSGSVPLLVTAARVVDCANPLKATVERFGELDILVDNAEPIDLVVRGVEKPIADQTAYEINDFVTVATSGTAPMLRRSIPHLIDRAEAVVNISSGSLVLGVPSTPTCTCTKEAVNTLTRQVGTRSLGIGIS